MKFTQRLLRRINGVFDKTPDAFLALRLRYDGQMSWTVDDNALSTTVTGGTGAALSVNLESHTLSSLSTYLAAQPGYSVPLPSSELLSATVLLDASGDQDTSNGDHLFGYQSVLWSYFEAVSKELATVKNAIQEAVTQLSTKTADDNWLEEIGSYYGVTRNNDEPAEQYGNRIISTVLMPRGNNVAIAAAIERLGDGIRARIVDAEATAGSSLTYNGQYQYDGTKTYSSEDVDYSYGLFDLNINTPLDGTGAVSLAAIVETVDRVRDAGTHLRLIPVKADFLDELLLSDANESFSISITDNTPAPGSDDGAVALF